MTVVLVIVLPFFRRIASQKRAGGGGVPFLEMEDGVRDRDGIGLCARR